MKRHSCLERIFCFQTIIPHIENVNRKVTYAENGKRSIFFIQQQKNITFHWSRILHSIKIKNIKKIFVSIFILLFSQTNNHIFFALSLSFLVTNEHRTEVDIKMSLSM